MICTAASPGVRLLHEPDGVQVEGLPVQMKSRTPGATTSEAEVTNIDAHGIWVYVDRPEVGASMSTERPGREYFLPYEDYALFRDAKVSEIINVELLHGVHLHWPSLDVDLAVDSLENPGKYPLVAE